jgi:hypothetical protein
LATKSTAEKLPTYYNTSETYLNRVTWVARMQEWGDWCMRQPAKGKKYIGTYCMKPDNIFTSVNPQFTLTGTTMNDTYALPQLPIWNTKQLCWLPSLPMSLWRFPLTKTQSSKIPLNQCKKQMMRKEIVVVYSRYLWKHLL